MLGVGSSIWNRALAGKGAGDGGNPPAEATPIHSLDLTAAPSVSNSFDDYGLALPRTVTDYNGRIAAIPANAVPMGGLRPVRNLLQAANDFTDAAWTKTNSGTGTIPVITPAFATHTVNGSLVDVTRVQFDCGAGTGFSDFSIVQQIVSSDNPLNYVPCGAIYCKLNTGTNADLYLRIHATDTSSSVTITDEWQRVSIAGVSTGSYNVLSFGLRGTATAGTQTADILVCCAISQDITHRADLSTAPDEYVSVGVGTYTAHEKDGAFAADWSTYLATATDGQSGPLNNDAVEIVFSATSGAALYNNDYLADADVGKTITVRVYAKGAAGGENFRVTVNSTNTGGAWSADIAVTNDFAWYETEALIVGSTQLAIRSGSANSADTIYVQKIEVKRCDPGNTGVDGFAYFDTELANTVASNVVTEGTGASIAGWLDYQPGDTNYADCTHDFSGGADTITLTATGSYTLWVEGTAQVSIAAGTATITGAGSATEGSPVTINCTATGTITLTLDSGTLDEWGAYQIIQLNDGTVPTAFIPSTGAASRPAMSPAPTISGLVGTEDARLTVTGLAADLVTPDPTDITERKLDVDNTDGEFDTLPSPIKVLSVDVYNDAERPD